MNDSILNELKNPTLISFLDLSRWLAAAIVFISHLRNPLFVSYGDINPDNLNIFIQAWYFITGWEGEAVIIFFVLSGLLVGASGYEKVYKKNFTLNSYLIDRVSRLYVALIPALILTFLLDIIGSSIMHGVGFWDHTHPLINEKNSGEPFGSKVNALNFFGNLLMLQYFFIDTLGSNGPLWTISAEFWFYMVFGLYAFVKLSPNNLRLFLTICITVIFIYFFKLKFFILFGYWMIGLFAGITRISVPIRPAVPFCLLILALSLSRFYLNQDSTKLEVTTLYYLIAFIFGLLIFSIRGRNILLLNRMRNINNFLASFSFSLYLIHFPLMLFIAALLESFDLFPLIAIGYQPNNFKGILLYILMIIIVYLLSYIFSLITEQKTYIVRAWLKDRFL